MTPHSGAVVLCYNGVKLLGVLNRPGGPERVRHPAVLFLHGFPGAEKNVDIQRRLLGRGVASLALHFSGAWGSEGEYAFSALVPQARAALRYLARSGFVDKRRLGIFGFSMGGWAALNVAALEPGLRAVVAVAPVGGPEMIGRDNRPTVEHFSRPLRIRSAAWLTTDFRRAVVQFNPHEAVARRTCPLLLVHGEADDVMPAAISRKLFAEAAAPKRLVVVHGARHDFLDCRQRLTRLTAEWLARRLT